MKDDFALKTIGEVSIIINVPQYVIRFWEKKFLIIKPIQKNNGRRYYSPNDIKNLKKIQNLLYHENYSIKGAQKILKNTGDSNEIPKNDDFVLSELKKLRDELKKII